MVGVMSFSNLFFTIKGRVGIIITLLFLSLFVLSRFSLDFLDKSSKKFDNLYNYSFEILSISTELKTDIMQLQNTLINGILPKDINKNELDELYLNIFENIKQIETLSSEKEIQQRCNFIKIRVNSIKNMSQDLIEAKNSGNYDEVYNILDGIISILKKSDNDINILSNSVKLDTNSSFIDFEQVLKESKISINNITFASFFILLTITLILYLSIIKSIKNLQISTKYLVSNSPNLNNRVEKLSNDEFGEVIDNINIFIEKVQTMDKQLIESNEKLKDKIDESMKHQKELEYRLYYDALTNIPNRAKLIDDIKNSEDVSLILINIDRFKEINDFYGIEIGDFILKEFPIRLQYILEFKDYKIYRLYGDEYAIAIFNQSRGKKCISILNKLCDKIKKESFNCNNEEIFINATLGFSNNRENLLITADIALREAKRSRRNFLCYDDMGDVIGEYENNIKWSKRIKKALEEDRIVPFFQPIINAKTKNIEKFECLARMVEGNKVISPFYFLDTAKKTKQYTKITRAIIKKSFEIFSNNSYEFSINLCLEDILDSELVVYIRYMLEKYNIGNRVIFEIVESEGIEEFDEVINFIKIAKSFKCKIAIDDFGSGYSNFEYLMKLDIDFIKIDGSLIKNIDKDLNSHHITETISTFAKKINKKVVAEYVASEKIYDTLNKLDIDYLQGFYLGEPKNSI